MHIMHIRTLCIESARQNFRRARRVNAGIARTVYIMKTACNAISYTRTMHSWYAYYA